MRDVTIKWLTGAVVLSALASALVGGMTASAEPPMHRSPVDVALVADESWLVTANQTSDSVSLVGLPEGIRLDEKPVGRRPAAIVIVPNSSRVVVSCAYGNELRLFAVENGKLKPDGTIPLRGEPQGIAVTADGSQAWVGMVRTGEVALVDLAEKKELARVEVGPWPRYVALSPDGSRLAVGISGSGGIAVVDAAKREVLFRETFGGMNFGQMQVSEDGLHVYAPWMTYRNNPISAGNIQQGWVLGSRIGRVRMDEQQRREGLTLDPRGQAIADPHGLALVPGGERIVVSAAGTHELLVFRREGLPFMQFGDPDHIDKALLADKERFFRIPLGGRPLGLKAAKDGRTIYVANYFDDAVQVVDLAEKKVARSLKLADDDMPLSAQRRGEAVFYDAKKSLDQWYSCHTCHYEGGTNNEPMDTLNDGSIYTNKTVLPLWRIGQTGPYTWHGWQKDLDDAMRKSITGTMQGRVPSDADVSDLIAYLRDLPAPPSSAPRDAAEAEQIARGEKLFRGEKAACATCHSGANFTDGEIHDVGLEEPRDRYRGFNTPTLLGVGRKVRWLHDGRARTLADLVTGPHSPAKVSKSGELTEAEVRDLVSYLRSL